MRRLVVLFSSALFLVAGCGGSDSSSITGTNTNGTGTTTNGAITATLDGAAWAGVSAAVVYQSSIISFAGTQVSNLTTISVASGNVTGPGTYPLTYSNSNFGLGMITTQSTAWSTAQAGGTGTLVITTLTANHLTATFSFDAPQQGGGTVRHVTNGKIDTSF